MVISINVAGQFHYIGVQGGLNLSNITNNDFIDNTKWRNGIITGLNYEFRFPGNLLIGADLLYIQNGFRSDLILTDEDGNILDKSAIKDNFDYLNLPIKFGYEIGTKKIKGFGKIGINTSMLLKAQTIIPYLDDGYKLTNDVSKFDLGGIIEIGAGYEINDNFEIVSLVGYRHSFTTLTSPSYFESKIMKHYSFSISVGLKYKLTKK